MMLFDEGGMLLTDCYIAFPAGFDGEGVALFTLLSTYESAPFCVVDGLYYVVLKMALDGSYEQVVWRDNF